MNKRQTTLRKVPSVVQLPGGITLEGIPFQIVEYDEFGHPSLFKILPKGTTGEANGRCTLFANERWIRTPVPRERR